MHVAPLQNEPTGQPAQLAAVADVTLPTVPERQLQAMYSVDPGDDTEGEGHGVQALALACEKVSAGHCVQSVAPASECEPAGQGCWEVVLTQ